MPFDDAFSCITELDYSLFILINQKLHSSFFDVLMPILRNTFFWVPVYVLLSFLYYKKFKIKFWYYIIFLLVCFSVTDMVGHQILKPFFGRERPCYNEIIHARLLLENCGGHWSFPSLHAANHFALSVGIVLTKLFDKKKWNCLVIFWAFTVSYAQIYVGVHYPFDIAMGFLFGLIVSCMVYTIFFYFVGGIRK
jgi:undecaprenyl-diphosphatase